MKISVTYLVSLYHHNFIVQMTKQQTTHNIDLLYIEPF